MKVYYTVEFQPTVKSSEISAIQSRKFKLMTSAMREAKKTMKDHSALKHYVITSHADVFRGQR